MEKSGHGKCRGIYIFSMEKETKIINWEQDFCTPQIVSAVKRVEFFNDRMSYIVLRGRWFNIIILNAHVLSDEKGNDTKDSFCEELEQVFDHSPQ